MHKVSTRELLHCLGHFGACGLGSKDLRVPASRGYSGCLGLYGLFDEGCLGFEGSLGFRDFMLRAEGRSH